MIRSLAIVASGAGAFLLTCLLVEHVLPPELPWLIREKVAHLAAHGNEYDALYLGSSRVENNMMPAVFDGTVAQHGIAIRSFNGGISAMYPPQDAYMLDRILASKPPRLRWVFVELQYLQAALPRTNRNTLEQVYWHDWPRFSLVCQWLVGTNKHRHWRDNVWEVVGRLPALGDHALLFARRQTNMGRGVQLLERWVAHEPAPTMDWELLDKNRDGWAPAGIGERRDAQTIASLDEELEQRRQKPPGRDSTDPVTQKAYDLMVTKIQQAGATPVLVVPPNAARGTYYYPRPERARHLIILDFCDPKKYPVLYATENRVDTSHLTPAGAEIFTRLLAERFVEATREGAGYPAYRSSTSR
ncbi:MAG: hypothetical protein P4L99_26060 [Chthoniobacter sp.]|nr:hypothetical protein [Chthoniobacter sp.]